MFTCLELRIRFVYVGGNTICLNYAYLNYVVHPISHELAQILMVTALQFLLGKECTLHWTWSQEI